ncbi:class I adenylate-forming enzyme family protein [Phenylobacterium sp.]|uniref:class I adenylate-forming enzyme family protein n=1 Tax=Phenylobacterium sp. TaxID=1871053 RepID=UPI0035AEB587
MTASTPLLSRVSDYAAWQAERRPDAEALVLGERRTTFRGLHEAVEALARALLAAGVEKGDRVATLQTPHPDYLTAFLATASIGAIWVGLNPRYRIGELTHVITDAEPAVLITRTAIGGRRYDEDIAALRRSAPSLRRVVAFDGEPAAEGVEPMAGFLAAGAQVSEARLAQARAACGGDDPCLIVYTSGSTGAPKGALLSHGGIARFCLEQNRLWPLDPFRSLNYFPINHVGCVIDCSLPCLLAGGALVFMEQFDPAESLALMVKERVTLWGSVPSVFQMQLSLPNFADFDLSAVQMIIWEGAAMPMEMIKRLQQIQPRMATNYGMTETTSAITALEPTSDIEVLGHSVGSAFPGVEVRLADAEGREAADGAEGEVQARSPYNLLGYWRRPEATAEAFTKDGFFRTGDLAVRRPDGRYRIVGRLKDMYKSGGYNVYPREVEAVLEAHPAVAQAAIVSAPDPVWQEVGVAFIEPRGEVSVGDLEAHCRSRLANYKVPKRFVIDPNLPLLPIGKIDKVTLKARAAAEA